MLNLNICIYLVSLVIIIMRQNVQTRGFLIGPAQKEIKLSKTLRQTNTLYVGCLFLIDCNIRF